MQMINELQKSMDCDICNVISSALVDAIIEHHRFEVYKISDNFFGKCVNSKVEYNFLLLFS